MNVASKDLCDELDHLSGWRDTQFTWKRLAHHDAKGWGDWSAADYNNGKWYELGEESIPAYDLGYLLRKLPETIEGDDGAIYRLRGGKNQYYFFEYQLKSDPDVLWWSVSPFGSPEDAACKLAIYLFKRDVLTKQGVGNGNNTPA